MATHSSILAWKIPWMEEPDRLQSVGSQRVRHNWATSPPSPPIFFIHSFIYRYLSCFHVLYSVNNAGHICQQVYKKNSQYNHQENADSNPQWDITSHLLEWLLSKTQKILSVGKDVEKKEPSCTIGGNVNWYSHYGKQYGGFSKN